MIPIRLVVEGGFASLYGMVWCELCVLWYWGDGKFGSTLISQYVCFLVAMYAYVRLDFLNCDFVWEPSNEMDCGSYEEFVWVIMLGGQSSDVVTYEVFVVQTIFENVHIARQFCVLARASQMT